MARYFKPEYPLIAPDYKKSEEEVFVEYATLMLRELPALEVLSVAEDGRRKQSNKLPSWCPDYRIGWHSRLFWPGAQKQQGPAFSASGPSDSRISIPSIQDGVLTVNGMMVDTIECGSAILCELLRIDKDMIGLDELFDVCAEISSPYPLTKQDRLEVLWRTMVIDQSKEETFGLQHYPAQSKVAEYFRCCILRYLAIQYKRMDGADSAEQRRQKLLDGIEARAPAFGSCSVRFPTRAEIIGLARMWVPTDSPDSTDATRKINMDANKFITDGSVMQYGARRCVFRTWQHRLLGLGPESLKKEDQVWLLKGGPVLFVLRPCGDGRFKYVGQAYVHGIMHGEWLEQLAGKDLFNLIEIA